MKKIVEYKLADDLDKFQQGKSLFEEYVASLNVDLSFQNFANELNDINQQYGAPTGALLLAYDKNLCIGCSGIRQIDHYTAELKRMYVKENYRGLKIGENLLQRSIAIAKSLGYKKIRLDTLANMNKAQMLYRSFGFYEIEPYRFNPLPGTIYMEKQLDEFIK